MNIQPATQTDKQKFIYETRKKSSYFTTAQEVCQSVLDQLRNSNLNFKICETPFSAEVILRKKFTRDQQGPTDSFMLASGAVENSLQEENQILRDNLNSREATIQILEEKMEKIEATALKEFKKRNDEILSYKSVISKHGSELSSLKAETSKSLKLRKQRENEVLSSEHKNENLSKTVKKLKEDLEKVKSEKHSINKELKRVKKVKKSVEVSTSTAREIKEDLNHNNVRNIIQPF